MIIRSVLESPSAVTVAVAPDEGEGEELFVLSPGEWKRLNRSLGYDPAAGLVLSPGQPVDEAVKPVLEADGSARVYSRDPAPFPSQVTLAVALEGSGLMPMVDYASAGKTWQEDSRMCAWFPVG